MSQDRTDHTALRRLDSHSARQLLDSIQSSSQHSLRDELIKTAVRYARLRCDWYLADLQQRVQMDQDRTLAHNVFIDTCNILARNMQQAGEDIGWRRKLGTDRKLIGDFACYLHCLIGIDGR